MIRCFAMCVVLLQGTLILAQDQGAIPPEARKAMLELRKEPFRAHMSFLADDLLEGRGTGTRGHEIAAKYVAAQFEAIGLKPGASDGSYFQRVPMRMLETERAKCSIEIDSAGQKRKLAWGTDYVPIPYYQVPHRDNTTIRAPLVFAGFGVTTPDGRYDDYAGLEAKGKIVAVLSNAPPSLSSELRATMADSDRKVRLARMHGAVGILFLYTPTAEFLYPWTKYVIQEEAPSLEWLLPNGKPGDIPEIDVGASLSERASSALFSKAPKSWKQVLEDAQASKPQGFPLQVGVAISLYAKSEMLSSPNVVAILPGSDPTLSKEYLIYTAHLDHLGIGPAVKGDVIYNGAVDDAAGVAALIQLAKGFATLQPHPKRSLIFLGTTGEEAGMLGSAYYANFPTVPIDQIVADINIDSASVFYKFKDVVPYGAWDSSLLKIVEREAAMLGLTVSPDPEPELLMFIRSDQYAFVRKGIPAVFLTEGFQAANPNLSGKKITDDWNNTRYHSPSDDMSQPLDFEAAVEFMNIDFLIGYDIAQDPERPRWNPGDFFGTMFARGKTMQSQ